MSNTRGGGRTNSSAAVIQSIPPASRKMVQSLKEIVNCPEAEIYATLKDCNMEPNEAVNRLLTQGVFLSSLLYRLIAEFYLYIIDFSRIYWAFIVYYCSF